MVHLRYSGLILSMVVFTIANGQVNETEAVCPSNGLAYLPNYGDCTKYYQCLMGVKTEMSCPEGEAWSIVISACDMKENVDCSYTTLQPATTSKPGFQCPAGTGTSLHPHPYDCSMFIECINGDAFPLNCPDGYRFSATDLKCELAAYVDCSYTSVSPTGTPPITIGPEFHCPATGISFHPHPYDCSKFIECIDGVRHDMDCPADYHFSAVDLKCELAAYVDCSYTSVAPVTTPKPSPTKIPDGYCLGRPNGSYLPYPGDCKKFIECSNGEGVIINCPEYTAWNQESLTCVHNPSNICP